MNLAIIRVSDYTDLCLFYHGESSDQEISRSPSTYNKARVRARVRARARARITYDYRPWQ